MKTPEAMTDLRNLIEAARGFDYEPLFKQLEQVDKAEAQELRVAMKQLMKAGQALLRKGVPNTIANENKSMVNAAQFQDNPSLFLSRLIPF